MDLPPADNLLTQPTRARLFARMREMRRAASTEELAKDLGLHVNGIRRQLELMEDGGLLERRRVTRGRGRPRDEWSIAIDARPAGERPRAYADLAGWLARAIPSTPEKLRQVEEVGREVGHEVTPEVDWDLAEGMRQVFTSLGFEPSIEMRGEGIQCRLGNCPYRRSVAESPEVICALHKGITLGLLDRLDPDARLSRFEPRDPEVAGCVVEVASVATS